LGIGSISPRGQRRGFLFGHPALNCFAGSTPATATGVACIKIN